MIETTNLSVSLGRREILSSVGMTARPGEMTVIVGPNGSGKTTLMKTLSGDLAYRGRVMFNGISLSSMKPWQMAALRAVLPQATTLAFPFTVHEVVRLGLTNGRSGALPDAVARLPERALARVGLENFSGRLYQELSGGEQQRVQLARVLCQVWSPVLEGQARYLFLDEPVSSLDVKHQLLIMNVARDYARHGGGVIAVLHDLNLAAMFADRIVMMHRGKIAASGTAADVLTEETLATIFDCRLAVGFAETGVPFVLPQSAA
ncbi:MAG: heme ABC transporter ATP-binding protein [Rhizobiaceae bacterium]|nr:MAG: heme ABC transporter ATP-binding protein [Rhizobiaceae bacterium]